MGIEKGTGIVLRARKSAESDLVVTWFSEAWGKRAAVVKRARRLESELGAVFEPLNLVEVIFYARSRVDLVSQGALLEGYRGLKQDLPRVSAALAVAHLLDRLLASHQPEERAYALLGEFLAVLEQGTVKPETAGLAAAVKLLALLGHRPTLTRCAGCGREDGPYVFLIGRGGLLCPSCQPGERHEISLGLARSLDLLLSLPLRRAGVLSLTEKESALAWTGIEEGIKHLATGP